MVWSQRDPRAAEPDRQLCAKLVGAIAAAEGWDPLALSPPLCDAVGLEGLEALVDGASGADLVVTFTCGDYQVRVDGEGSVAVTERSES